MHDDCKKEVRGEFNKVWGVVNGMRKEINKIAEGRPPKWVVVVISLLTGIVGSLLTLVLS
jgi:hypothetical protein